MNNVSLVGRLTKDVELRYTAKKTTAVGSFVLAVDREPKKGVAEKSTDFIPVVVWGKTAEFAGKYFAKGHRVALQGNIHTRTWEDEQKNKHYVTEVIAEKVFLLTRNTGNWMPGIWPSLNSARRRFQKRKKLFKRFFGFSRVFKVSQ